MGVDEALPRTPAVFEEKLKWNLEEVDAPGAHEQDNYGSLAGHMKEVGELFEAEAKEGWMVEYTDDEAKNKFGDRLFVAGLAVVQEPGKITTRSVRHFTCPIEGTASKIDEGFRDRFTLRSGAIRQRDRRTF